ncbi:MaoC/PaaZ C-terminal domain-containing protein [Cryobacterium sp.]|uniref:MaoC/PaaZ C-terminal domain-containing protein n=1 Tax=Cryobacterium sp. TaxID=1926290 RepID=UPI00345DB214
MHLDPAAALAGPFGGLIASGWHTTAVMMRIMVDNYLNEHQPGLPGRGRAPVDPSGASRRHPFGPVHRALCPAIGVQARSWPRAHAHRGAEPVR